MGAGARAKALITDGDVTQKKLAKQFGITEAKLSNYLSEKNEMPARVVAQLAAYFRVTTDYLLGLTEDPGPGARLSDSEQALVEGYRGLTREQRELVLQTVRLMREQNRR